MTADAGVEISPNLATETDLSDKVTVLKAKTTNTRSATNVKGRNTENRTRRNRLDSNSTWSTQRRMTVRNHNRGPSYPYKRGSIKLNQQHVGRRSSKVVTISFAQLNHIPTQPISIKNARQNQHNVKPCGDQNILQPFLTSPRRNAIAGSDLKVKLQGRKVVGLSIVQEQKLASEVKVLKISKQKKIRNSKKKPIPNRNITIGSPIIETFTSTRSFDTPTIHYNANKLPMKLAEPQIKGRVPLSQYISAKLNSSPPAIRKLENWKTSFRSSSPPKFRQSPTPGQGEVASLWKSKENCVWCNMAGERVELQEVDLLSLSESECFALQKVAAQHLHDSDLCASFTIPKDEYKLMTGKKGFHLLKAKNKSKKQDHVFAIPLVRVVENDQLLRLQTIEQDNTACTHFDASQDASDSDSLVQSGQSPKVGRRDSSSVSESVFTSIDSPMSASPVTNEDVDHEFMTSSVSPKSTSAAPVRNTLRRRAAINTEIDPDQSKLLESLSESSIHNKKRSLLPPTMPQVPYVVQKCCAHLVKHGLDVTGIFRVPGSKKRVKQLREEFDRGVDVKVEDDYMAHDVAALFKEFFRDLPEALLTRELYQAFISTTKLGPADRLAALRCLVWLLPMPNRDTIQQLLSFLSTVAESSQDRVDANGKTICGNKMGISNLAMIFGPNILHRNKKTSSSNADAQYQVQSLERAEESTMVISVVEDMIRNQKELFLVPCETHDEVLRTLQESDPDALDVLLRRKAVNYARNGSPHTSSGQASDGSVSDEDEILSMDRFSKINANNNNSIKIPYVHGNDSSAVRTTPTIIKEQILKSGPNTQTGIARPIPEKEQKAVDLLMDEISFSPPPFSKSISFSDADMKEILYRDVSPQKTVTATKNADGDKTHDAVKIIKNDLHDNAHDFNHTDVNKKTSSRPVPKPRTHVTTQIQKGENSLKDMSQQSRRQAFSLNPRVSQTNTTEKGSKNGPVIDEDSTSGIADCSISYNSCNGDSVHSDHEIHNSVPALSNEIESRDLKIEQEDPPIRKRLPSTLNLRLNRTYGAQSHGAMHAVRIPKKRTEKNSNPENEVVYRQTKSSARNHPLTRRFSKDDMFATLERYQHRHEQRHCINYNKLLTSNEEMV